MPPRNPDHSLRHRHGDDETVIDRRPRRRIAPGKVSLTSRLPPRIQRQATGPAPAVPPDEALASARKSTGSPLPGAVADWLHEASGHDVSSVRVHDGPNAHRAARDLGARAFTTGSDIYFARGTYQPDTEPGRRLIAHEVAHTVQQRGAATGLQAKLEVSEPGDAAELEADAFADAVVRGFAAPLSHAPRRSLQREADPDAPRPGDVDARVGAHQPRPSSASAVGPRRARPRRTR